MTFAERSFFVGPDAEPDKYRLRAQVSAGGEAELWRADVAVAGEWEPVAVKILRTDLYADVERWRNRWAEQAELLRFIRHPAVVGIREDFEGPAMHLAGEADQSGGRSLYLVMNWVEGQDLRSWVPLHRNPEGILEAIRYLQQVATVLEWLHSGQATPSKREVIHADVSPANVIVTPAGQAVLVDFGLLRVAAQTSGTAEGTYMAPEVRSQGQYSPASDRYSFGGLAYFVLTGNHPPTDPAALRAGLGQVGMIAAQPGLLEQLLAIFSDDPTLRPGPGEWVRLLRQSSSTVVGARTDVGLPPPAPGSSIAVPGALAEAPARRSRRPMVIAAVVALVALAAGGTALALSSSGGNPRPAAAVHAATTSTAVAQTTTTFETTTTVADTTTTAASSDTTSTTVATGSPVASGPVKLLDPNNQSYVVSNSAYASGNINIGINGNTYTDAAEGGGPPQFGTTGEIDFNLSRSFHTFAGRVGVVDTSPTGCVAEIQILADGKPMLDQTFGLGSSKDLSFDMTGVLRLQIIFAKTVRNATVGRYCFGGLGEPTVS